MPKQDTSRVSLDFTSISVVVTCTSCTWWRGFALDRIEGWTVGDRHQRRAHRGNTQALNALLQAKERARTPKE